MRLLCSRAYNLYFSGKGDSLASVLGLELDGEAVWAEGNTDWERECTHWEEQNCRGSCWSSEREGVGASGGAKGFKITSALQ